MFVLELLDEDGGALGMHPVGARPIYVGRSPQNDVVVLESTVSARHLAVFLRGRQIHVEDLASRNGTFVGDNRVTGFQVIGEGEVFRAGTQTLLRVRASAAAPVAPGHGVLVLEDVDAGLRLPLLGDRFRIGSRDPVDLHVPEAPPLAATLVVHDNGEVWLGVDDVLDEVEIDTPFEVAGRRFVVRRVAERISVTREVDTTAYPYTLSVALDAPGPLAVLDDPVTGARCALSGETRAILLYVLARGWRRDRDAGLPPDRAGWCDDDEVSVGIWGRGEGAASRLNVLVCRVRKDLREAGFDPWCVEKRRGAMRVRVAAVTLPEG